MSQQLRALRKRRVLLPLLCTLLLIGASWGGVSAGEPAIYDWDLAAGDWYPISPISAPASLSVSGAQADACDKEDWLIPFQTQVAVASFEKEIEKTAIPLTSNVIVLSDGTFQVPRGEMVTWLVHLAVKNLHETAITGAVVEDRFDGEFAVIPQQPSQGELTLTTSGAIEKVHLLWVIGELPAGASASADLLVSTKRNPAGKQEFTSTGPHTLNSGATLKYKLDMVQHSAVSASLSIAVIDRGVSSRTVARSLAGNPLLLSQVVPACIDDDPAAPIFIEDFVPMSPEISRVPADGGFPAGFSVPSRTRVVWRLELTVRNPSRRTYCGLEVRERLGAELAADRSTLSVSPAPPRSAVTFDLIGNTRICWQINSLAPGEEAKLSMLIYTRTNQGGQLYGGPTLPASPNWLNSGATLRIVDPKVSLTRPAVPVWVDDAYLRVSLNASRYDWQIRKPGIYAASPISIQLESNRQITVTFSGFADLAAEPPGTGAIPADYAFGKSLSGIAAADWISATSLNALCLILPSTASGPISLSLWPRIRVDGSARAGAYRNTGTITFTVLENLAYVERPAGSSLAEEVMWVGALPGVD